MSHRQRSRRRAACTQAIQSLEPRRLMSYSVVDNSAVVMNTSLGEVVVQLYSDLPITTKNFLSYVAAGTYNNTIFHRITSNGDSNQDTFGIVQGGGFTGPTATSSSISPVSTQPAITLEATPNHPNSVGTIAMARTSGSVNSASSQFFFNTTDNSTIFDNNPSDNGSNGTNNTYNPYTAFGNVIRGLGIVDTIDNLSTTASVTASNGATLNPPEINTSTSGGSPFVTITSATEEDTMTATMGPHDAAGTRTISFFDAADGATTTISLSGADSTLTFTGTNLVAKQSDGNLKVTGTNLQLDSIAATTTGDASNLTFSSPGRNKHVDLGDITITGSLNSITGSGINLTGDIDVSGGVNKIQFLASNAAGHIFIDTSGVQNAPATIINIPFLSDITIQSGAPIKELITREYLVNDGTSRGVSSAGAITKVKDFGPMEASVSSSGAVSSFQASVMTGSIQGATINSVKVSQFEGPFIFSSAPYNPKTLGIKSIKVLGSLQTQQGIVAIGNIGSIQAGSMTGTNITAGFDNTGTNAAIGGFSFGLAADATIQSVSLKTPKGKATSFSDSQIVAGKINSLRLGRVTTTIPSGSALSVMGIQTTDLKSLTATTDQGQSLDLSNITTQSALNTAVSKRGLQLSVSATLGSALASGTAYKTITLKSPIGASLPSGTTLTVTSGSNTQTITLSAATNPASNKLSISSVTPSASYPVGSAITAPGSFTFDIIPASDITPPSS